MPHVTSGALGVNLALTYAGTTTDGAGAPFSMGQIVEGTDATIWVFVQAGAAISQYAFVAIDENFQAQPITGARVTEGQRVGVAQVAFADNEFGWVAISGSGSIKGLVRSSCASGVPLYTDVSGAGFLDDSATATQALIEGVVILTTQSSSTAQEGSGVSLILSYPRYR